MATAPKFKGPDGVLRTEFIFTTTRNQRFFTGQISATTIDLQVSIRGSGFSSDPDYVVFEGTEFTIPNPVSFPDGLDLAYGDNLIEVRALEVSGTISPISRIKARVIQESDIGVIVQPPTKVSLERRENVVAITIEGINNSFIKGYNFRGSASPGGGTTGYLLLNPNLVGDGETSEKVTTIGSLQVDASLPVDRSGNLVADPLFVNITANEQDKEGNVLQTDYNELLEIPETVRNLRYTQIISRVETVTTFTFVHDRRATQSDPNNPAIPRSAFTALLETDPIYYVATAVWYDPSSRTEIESSYSSEVLGTPLVMSQSVGSFPFVSRQDIIRDLSLSIYRKRPEIKIEPGSVTRDVFIDPFSSEAQRLRFITDFLHRAQSFSSLLTIDDPSNSGTSIPVTQSSYKRALKQAFHLVDDDDVQSIVDQTFEKLASNFGLTRREGIRARGEVVFYTQKRPTASINIPIGSTISGGGVRFTTTSVAQISLDRIASFFSATTGRYSVRVPVQAVSSGSSGNVGIGQIRTINVGPTGLNVTNDTSTFGGKNRETNRELAVRTIRVLSSVDSGTHQGYYTTAVDVPGVTEVFVVDAGDTLMWRDFDIENEVHRGGKVDVWVRGTQENTVTDSFAFSFEMARDILFEPVGDLSDLEFRAVDSRLSSSFPLIEMLDIPEYGYGLRNETTDEEFDLTGVEILSYNTIKLSTSVVQPALTYSDVVRGDYRYRTSNKYIFPRQPVKRIESFEGSVTGVVTADLYDLYKLDSPLANGRSTLAQDYLQLTDPEDAAVQIPSPTPIFVSGEEHVILAEIIEYVENLGTNPLTVQVFNLDRSIEYKGPFDPSGDADYTILYGDEKNPLGIKRTDLSTITSGQTILIDYYHDENFTVSYSTNYIVTAVQQDLEGMKHITADVLAKEATLSTIDLTATIVLKKGATPSSVDSVIQTNLINQINALKMGEAFRPSDVISIIDGSQNVSYVQSLTKMVRGAESLIIRESIVSDQDSDVVKITSWSTDTVDVYLIEDELANGTTDAGGSINLFRGVFQSEVQLSLEDVDPSTLGISAGRAFIIGNNGWVIPGYSDDATLEAEGYTTSSEKEAERKALTANRVVVSFVSGDIPVNYDYTVTYIVGEDSGVKSLEASESEAFIPGIFEFTYDEDTR